jgi:hypothetical protein
VAEVAVRLLLAVALLFGLSACQPEAMTNSQQRIYCQVVADAPARDNDQSPTRIISQVRYWCDRPGADRLNLTLRMQKQTGAGDWVNVAMRTFTVSRGQTVREDARHSRTVWKSVWCADGIYRTVVTGSSVARSRRATYEVTTGQAVNPCRPLLPR